MKISCERDALACALALCRTLCRAFPDLFWVTLEAREPEEGRLGSLDVSLWSESSGVGVLAHVAAEVVAPGSVTVPARLTASALQTMPQCQIHLSSVVIPDPTPASHEEWLKPLKGGPALQMEGTSTTGLKQCTRVRLCAPASPPAAPSLATWQANSIPLATITPRALREALEPCVLLTKQRVKASEETPGMDHGLVLVRFDPDALVCIATTRSAVVQSTRAWTHVPGVMPLAHALVEERMLRWLRMALHKEKRPVTLALVSSPGPAQLLLFSLPHCTLVCRCATVPIPLVWEQRMSAPASQVLLLSRPLFLNALDILSAGRAGYATRSLVLSVVDQRLCMQQDPLAHDEQVVECQIPIVNSVAESEPVLLPVREVRRILGQMTGPAICLEAGTVLVSQSTGTTGEPVPVAFVRFSTPAEKGVQFLLAVSVASRTEADAPVSASVQEAALASA
ncbi:MAG TPA: hypothetical protein VFV38_17055 [Ktedonobacteraceae bacterium]|nr:hypothetical protein [Ktedonobacteraceae bacterium]